MADANWQHIEPRYTSPSSKHKMKRRIDRSKSAALLILALSGCGGSDVNTANQQTPVTPGTEVSAPTSPAPEASTPSVQYEETTLLVDGVRYERSAGLRVCDSPDSGLICKDGVRVYEAREVLVMFSIDEKRKELVEAEIGRLGLSIKEQQRLDGLKEWMLIVSVPQLFEEQWMRALNANANTLYDKGAFLNLVMFPASESKSASMTQTEISPLAQ